jgi:peptidyl-prolyl cis-trans isomerase B (cyclophilin B)
MGQRQSATLVLSAVVLSLVLGLSFGCAPQTSSNTPTAQTDAGSQPATATSSESTPSTPESSLHTPTYKINGKEIAVIKTSKGTIKTKFFADDAPIAAANFIELARKGFYNGIRFHRYVQGFVVQAGDPLTKSASAKDVAAADTPQGGMYGTGGPGYTIKDEYFANPNKHLMGTLAMARTDAPNSGGSQFYFALAPWPDGDGQYTVFGHAISGLDVIKKLRAGDEIVSITIENASK